MNTASQLPASAGFAAPGDLPTVLLSSGFPATCIDVLRRAYRVVDIESPAAALDWLRTAAAAGALPLAVVVGYVNPSWPTRDDDNFEGAVPAHRMLAAIQQLDRDLPVIISTRHLHPAAIVELVKRGGFDYVIEAFNSLGVPPPLTPDEQQARRAAVAAFAEEIGLALHRAVRWRRTVLDNRRLRAGLLDADLPVPIHARSDAMRRVVALARKVAPTHATVLISGESGVGKEVVARLVHGLSPRRDAPYLAINCGALDDPLLNSELFGHTRGAFTGADRDRLGLLREAAAGTVLLDEIATISPALQVNLLRVLEDRRARAVGSQKDYPVECRFLAAANRELDDLVQEGAFREDLYYRLHVFHIRVPPLRDRRDDIPLLAQSFLSRAVRDLGKPITGFAPSALAWLERQPWPGNVRQLRNVIERAVILCDTDHIQLPDLDDHPVHPDGPAPVDHHLPYDDALRAFERDLLRRAMESADGNISAAARLLHMKRTTLTYRLRHLGL